MQRYDSYKDSGVKWLGEIPSHWELVIGKRLYTANDGGAWGKEPTGEGDTIVLRSTEQDLDGNLVIKEPASRHLNSSEKIKTELKENDLIVTKSSGSLAHIGKTSLIDKSTAALKCSYSNFIQRLKIKGHARFYWYVFNNKFVKDQFVLFSTTTTGLNNLSSKILDNILLPIPHLIEQEAIANYLDSVTSKIDEAIAQQQKMIDLLNERKQIIINDAVTKGLKPDAPMKDSGVDWIGKIPERWEVIPLKHLVTYNDEVLLESEKKDKHIKYVEISDVDYASGIKNHTEYLFKDAPSRARRITRKGDVIVSTVRTYLRAVASVNTNDLIVSTGFAVLRAKKMREKYLAYYILSDTFIDEVVRRSVGTSYPAINANDLVSISLIYPTLIEQEDIANYLDSVTSKIDEAIVQQQKMISLLQERKQIIINEVVTGKVKVV